MKEIPRYESTDPGNLERMRVNGCSSKARLLATGRVYGPMRLFTLMALTVFAALPAASAQGPASVAAQYLFHAANAERAQHGLRALRWDDALSRAATLHAREMADRESISHQYPGEEDLADRAQSAGAQFSVVAENVAEAPNAVTIHDAWMHSPDHRANLLDERVDRIGIGVLVRNGEVYAVEDFDRDVAALSFEDQETAIASLLSTSGNLHIQIADESARRTCAMSSGFAGDRRPWFVMRFTTGELDEIPDQLRARLASGRFHSASIGACPARGTRPFTSYNIAVLLFP